MGIKSASSLLYPIKGLSVKSVKDIINNIYFKDDQSSLPTSESQDTIIRKKYLVDVDCNWVACHLGATNSPDEAASITCDFLEALSQYGFVVTPICDGERRHHSKRATVDRIAKREKLKAKTIGERFKLLSTSQKLQNISNLDITERQRLGDEREALNKSVKSLEKKINTNKRLLSSFATDLERELQARGCHLENDNYGLINPVKIGFFQADSLLARRAVEKKSHFIISSDTDFFVHLGSSCLLIRGFKLSRARGKYRRNIDMMKIHSIEVAVSSLETSEMILKSLDENEKKKVEETKRKRTKTWIQPPKEQLFQNEKESHDTSLPSSQPGMKNGFPSLKNCGAEPTLDGSMPLVKKTDLESVQKLSLQSLMKSSQDCFAVRRAGLNLQPFLLTTIQIASRVELAFSNVGGLLLTIFRLGV